MIAADWVCRSMKRNAAPAWLDGRCQTWLADGECHTYGTLRDRGRRQEWLLGRWLAKRLVSDRLPTVHRDERTLCLRDIEVTSRDQDNRPMRPRVTVGDRPLEGSLSITHSPTTVLVAWCETAGIGVGVDQTPSFPATAGFMDLWFSTQERAWAREQANPHAAATLWAVKEAAYKALGWDEPFEPRTLETQVHADGIFGCRYQGGEMPFRHEIRTHVCNHEVVALALFDHRNTPARQAETTIQKTLDEAAA
jgi:phosphopantetheinyl transferase (holo-ACP synthase)